MKSKHRVSPHRSNDTSVKFQSRVRRKSLSRSAVCALTGSFALAACLMVSLANLSLANAAESKKETASNHNSRSKQSEISIDLVMPYKLDEYTIGNPAEKNNYPGVYSGLDNPGTVPVRGFYSTACSPINDEDIVVYTRWNKGPQQAEVRVVDRTYTIMVIYFIEGSNKQYIYGTISNGRALTDGVPVFVESKYWDCQISKQ